MKSFYSLPENGDFFNRYASLVPTLFKLGFLAQIVSAFTEIGIIYSQVNDSLADFWPAYARIGASFAALIGTAFLEVGLRKFTPYTVRAILFRRFRGLDLAMTIVIMVATVLLFSTSGLLSFQGSKSMVKAIAPEARQQSTVGVDSTFEKDRLAAVRLYRSDSSEIAQRVGLEIKALEQAAASKIELEQTKLKRFITLEERTGNSYISSKNRIEARIKELAADRDTKIAELASRQASELAAVAQVRKSAIDSALSIQQKGKSVIFQENQDAKVDTARKIDTYGGGLAWFTVICLFVFALSVTLKEIHQKGSGIEEKVLPTQYDFSDTMAAEFLQAVNNRFQQFVRSKIYSIEENTPPPPVPIAPAGLYNIAKLDQPIIDLVLKEPGTKTLAIGDGGPPEVSQAGNLAEIALRYYEAAKELEQSGLPDQAKALELKADDVLKMYLGKEGTPQKVTALRGQCVDFLSGKGPNPFSLHHYRPIGFNYQGKAEPSVSNATVTNAKGGHLEPKACLNCGQTYQPKVAWQKYCSSNCKEEYHAKKHGGTAFDAKAYHKSKRKKK